MVNNPKTQTSVGASIEGTNVNAGSVVANVNQKKRSLDSPEGGKVVKKQESYPRLGKGFGWETTTVLKLSMMFILKQIAK